MKLIDKKEFAKAVLNKNVEIFIVHVTFFNLKEPTMLMHPAKEALIALLLGKEIKILTKYSDFSDVFSEEKALVLPELTDLNQHAIKLQDGQQLLFGLIYSLGPIELKTLKTYIEINLTNGFI